MKDWAWLLPCWVWKYFFAQFPKERVLVDGQTRSLVRLDEDFALVYHPQGKGVLPNNIQVNECTRRKPDSSFRAFEKASVISCSVRSKQDPANLRLSSSYCCWHAA